MVSLEWISPQWFDLLQSAGIVASIVFGIVTLRTDTKVRKVQHLFAITKQHREIWSELYTKPELARVLESHVDLKKNPITREEELFVRFLLLHLKSVFRAIEARFYTPPDGLHADIRAFLSLPIPRRAWEATKEVHDVRFVAFVERCMDGE